MTFDTSNSFVRGRLVTLFLIGVMLLVFAIQQLVIIWTPRSSLSPFRGTLQSSKSYVTTVSSENSYGHETKSQKAELIIYLHEHKKKFVLMENIGSNYRNEEYDEIETELKHANSVTVWIKTSETDYWEPKVFQIETDRGTILDFQTVRFKDRPLTGFLLIMGLGCMIFPIYIFYPRTNHNKSAYTKRQHTTSGNEEQDDL